MLTVVLVSAVVYVISFLLTRALSRYRELSADRSGALLTGQPSKLASALTKATGEMARIPTRDIRQAEAFNAFFFAVGQLRRLAPATNEPQGHGVGSIPGRVPVHRFIGDIQTAVRQAVQPRSRLAPVERCPPLRVLADKRR